MDIETSLRRYSSGLVRLCLILLISFILYYQFNKLPVSSLNENLANNDDSNDELNTIAPKSVLGQDTINSNAPSSAVPLPETVTQTLGPGSSSKLEFGIAGGGGLIYLGQKDLNQYFDSLKLLGVRWVRWDIDWSVIQQDGPTIYNWAGTDRVAETAGKYGINSLGIITYTPKWARVDGCYSNKCEPKDFSKFADFAAEVAARYSPKGIHTWEIWNEPNYSFFWKPKPDVEAYAALLKKVYKKIKIVDQDSLILNGGFASAMTGNNNISAVDFISELYLYDAGPYFDAVANHPYTYPYIPSYYFKQSPWYGLEQMYEIMKKNGDGEKKIWITEFGAPTGGPGVTVGLSSYKSGKRHSHVSEPLQSEILLDSINSIKKYPWAGPFFWYTYKDSGTSINTDENFFGLLRYDGSKKPAYTTFQKIIQSQSDK